MLEVITIFTFFHRRRLLNTDRRVSFISCQSPDRYLAPIHFRVLPAIELEWASRRPLFTRSIEDPMTTPATTEKDIQSFAEAALRLSGKSEEEARRTGAVDKADEQVEALFAPQYQTANSPVHKAVWDQGVPLEL